MSDLIVKDGTGAGFRAGVTSDNRLRAEATTITENSFRTSQGNAYVIPTLGIQTLTLADTEYPVLWLTPNDPLKTFSIQRYTFSVRDTDPVIFRVRFGATQPVANNVPVPIANTNTTSRNQPSIIAEGWNGVGVGMTVPFTGIEAAAFFISRGTTELEIDGALIWGFATNALITCECQSTNLLTFAISGWEETL